MRELLERKKRCPYFSFVLPFRQRNDFFVKSEQNTNAVLARPVNNQMEPSAPVVPEEVELAFKKLPDFDCYEIFHPKVQVTESKDPQAVEQLYKVWSLSQLYSVDFLQSRIGVKNAFSTNAQSKFASAVLDGVLLSWDL